MITRVTIRVRNRGDKLKELFAERRVFMGTLELFDITRYVSEKNVEILRGGICL